MPANRQNNSSFFDYGSIGNVDLFTNLTGTPTFADKVKTTQQSQATPVENFGVRDPNSWDDAPKNASGSPGVGTGTSTNSADSRGNDDNPPSSSNTTQQVINQQFAGQAIVPQPNVLDQYASYTYAISWWLLTPDQYNASQNTRAPSFDTGNWTLLCQSGGAPVGQRNSNFPVDFYLDDLEIETFLMGKGTSMSTNAMDLRFKVVEPNGITLIQRLYEAVVGVYKSPTASTGTTGTSFAPGVNTNAVKGTPNYAAAIYALTIQFYGYDSQGNLAAPATGQYAINGQLGANNNTAVIQKYYPFQIINITFRTVANQVEYLVTGRPVPYATGTAQARGTIPFAFSLAGQTAGQILQGSAIPYAVSASPGERQTTASPSQSSQRPTLVQDLPIQQQAAIAAGTDPNAVTESGMAFGGGGLSG